MTIYDTTADQIQSAIDMLERIKRMALAMEGDMREDDTLASFRDALETLCIELLPDDYPLDAIDAALTLAHMQP